MFSTYARALRASTLGLLACGFASSAFAQADEEPAALSINATYTGDIWGNTRGGLKSGEKYLDNFDLTASVDTEKAFSLPGGTFFIYGLYNNHHTLSDTLTGDLQTLSNIDTPYATHLYEAWYEQKFGNGLGSLKVGLYDLNSEFDSIDTSGLFLSSSHGIGPDFSQSGLNGPSIFPVTSLAARFEINITPELLFRTAVLDAVPGDLARPKRAVAVKLNDGALVIGEAEASVGSITAALGVWHYTSKFDDLQKTDPRTRLPISRGGNTGIYVEADGQVTSPYNDERGLAVFGRFGFANANINQLSTYVGGGLAYTGLLAARPEDKFGLAVARANNGSIYRRVQAAAGTPADRAETSFELTYRAQLTEWLAIQPDVQYIINPGTDPALKDALAVGLRFELSAGRDF